VGAGLANYPPGFS